MSVPGWTGAPSLSMFENVAFGLSGSFGSFTSAMGITGMSKTCSGIPKQFRRNREASRKKTTPYFCRYTLVTLSYTILYYHPSYVYIYIIHISWTSGWYMSSSSCSLDSGCPTRSSICGVGGKGAGVGGKPARVASRLLDATWRRNHRVLKVIN